MFSTPVIAMSQTHPLYKPAITPGHIAKLSFYLIRDFNSYSHHFRL